MNLKEYAEAVKPLIDAVLEGKTLQYKNYANAWIDIANEASVRFLNVGDHDWRVKPEPRELLLLRGKYPGAWWVECTDGGIATVRDGKYEFMTVREVV